MADVRVENAALQAAKTRRFRPAKRGASRRRNAAFCAN
jgi:hypothetical protein